MNVKNLYHWLEGKGKQYQSWKFSQEEIMIAYEIYLNDLTSGSSSSKESNPIIQKWKAVPKEKVDFSQTAKVQGNVSVDSKPLNDFI